MSAMEGYHMFSFTILLLICVTARLCSSAGVLQSPDDGHQVKEGTRAAEDYMRKLYQQTVDEHGELKQDIGFSSVSCFTGAVVHVLEDSYREAEEKCTNIARFSFNLSSLANIQPIALQKGLLRVYMQVESTERADIEITVRIPASNTVLAGTHQVTTTEDSSGWVEISVTDGLQTHFSSMPHIDQLEVSLQAKLDCKEQGINAPAIRFTNPLLVVFMNTDEKFSAPVDELHLIETFKRSTDPIDHEEDVGESGFGEATPSEEPTAICRRQPLILNSTSLVRNAVIIQPRSVDFGYCSGSCMHSIFRTASARGALFTYLQLRAPAKQRVPAKLCCSPNVLESLDLLLRSSNGVFRIIRYPDVIARSCGCQA